MRRVVARALAGWLSCSLLLACSGDGGDAGEVGESCETPGGAGECVDGAVCHDRNSGDSAGVCRVRCNEDGDCPDGGSCEDVSEIDGDVKGCL